MSSIRLTFRLATLIAGIAALTATHSHHIFAQTPPTPVWQEVGPGPISVSSVNSFTNVEISGSGSPSNGAIHVVLPNPTDANTVYVGATNGGIWKTSDGGNTWNPLTDKQQSLSIGALAFDSADATQNTLVAGFGNWSNYAPTNGPLKGIIRSTDGGMTWTNPGSANLEGNPLAALVANGSTVVAAVDKSNAFTQTSTAGIFRSTDGGATFTAATGLPNGNVNSLIGDPTNSSRLFAGVANGKSTAGVYVSTDGGATWSPIANQPGLASSDTKRILLSAAGNGTLIAGVLNSQNNYSFYRFDSQGTSWVTLGKPADANGVGLFPGGQVQTNSVLLVDPNNPNIVYVGGDRQPDSSDSPYTGCSFNTANPASCSNAVGAHQYSGRLYRGQYDPSTGQTTWTPLTNDYTASATSPHADSRSLALDANGNLLEGDDGGIYKRTLPQGKGGDWVPLLGSAPSPLRVNESLAAAWNPIANIATVGAQDNGMAFQSARGGYPWSSSDGGDGALAAVNAVSGRAQGIAYLYGSYVNLSDLFRFQMDSAANVSNMVTLNPTHSGKSILGKMEFFVPFTLNRTDPTYMAIGGEKAVYVGQDTLTSPDIPMSKLSFTSNNQAAGLAYGVADNTHALLVGTGDNSAFSGGGDLYVSVDANPTALTRFTNYNNPAGAISVAFDGRTYQRIYAGANDAVYRGDLDTSNLANTPFTNLTSGGIANFTGIRALEFVSNNGVNALLAGGVSTVANGSNVYVTSTPEGNSPAWRAFSGNIPNALIFSLHYNAEDDVLLAGTMGRGVWIVYDTTTYFPEATTLTFGQADNDSTPDVSLLTDGTAVDGTTFSRPLIKTGAGTLTLPNAAAAYTGGTQFNGGAIAASSDTSFGPSGGWSFNGGTLRYLAGFASSRQITLNTGGGTFDTNSNIATLSGLISGPGSLTVAGGGNLTLTGSNVYSGGTTVSAGTLTVSNTTGSATGTGDVTIGPDGSLGGNGSIGGHVNHSGTVRPGTSIGTLRIAGNYSQGPKAKLVTEVASPASNDLLAVGGRASLSGVLQTAWLGGYVPAASTRFGTILTAASGVSGRFTSLLTNITPSVLFKPRYDVPNQVYLVVERDYLNQALAPFLTATQRAVAGMLNSVGNSAKGDLNTVMNVFDNLTVSQTASALDQLSPKGSEAQSSMGVGGATFQTSNLSERLRDLRYGVRGTSLNGLYYSNGSGMPVLLASANPDLAGMLPSGADEKWGFFARGNAYYGDQKDRPDSTGYDVTSVGVTVGSDYRFTKNFIAGLMLGLNSSRANVDSVGSKVKMDGYTIGAYGTYYRNNFYVDGSFGYGFADYDNSRRIVFPGIDRSASSRPNGQQMTAYGGTGYDLKKGNWIVTPNISLQYVKLTIDSYTESGAGALSLDVDRQNTESFQGNVGGIVSYALKTDKFLVMPNVRASYGYEFRGESQNLNARLVQGGSPFSVTTAPPNRNFVVLGAGINTLTSSNGTSFYVNYAAQIGADQYIAHNVNAGVRLHF